MIQPFNSLTKRLYSIFIFKIKQYSQQIINIMTNGFQ